MKKVIVNNGASDARVIISKVEEKYNAKFVGQLPLRGMDGNWSEDNCADIFYQAVPPIQGYSNYFGLIYRNHNLYILSGASAVVGVINGIQAEDGEIIYSRYRHDYRTSTDGSVFIDGGRDYVKTGGGHQVLLKIVDGEWYVVEDEEDMIVLRLKGEL